MVGSYVGSRGGDCGVVLEIEMQKLNAAGKIVGLEVLEGGSSTLG